jgi:hypothetical protein
LPNPEAKTELLETEEIGEIHNTPRQIYHENRIYEVVESGTNNPGYYLIPEEEVFYKKNAAKKKAKVLKPGDRVQFKG